MTPALTPAPPPSTVLLFRTPVPPSQGTDPYHDAFGAFCLPSFPLSALDSGAATPVSLLPMSRVNSHSSHAAAATTTTTTTTANAASNNVSSATAAGGPRPEELLLHALQQQQQQQQHQQQQQSSSAASSSQQRESSPGRKYTRRQPSYHASSSDSAQSFVLTTHHLAQYVPDPAHDAGAGDAQCTEREWCVTSLPVLGTDDANAQQFRQCLADGEWGAVVATSGRAWDVWKDVAIQCQRSGKSPRTNYPDTPFFLISSRSAATFRSTTLPDVPSLWAPKANKVYGAPPTKGGAKKDGTGSNSDKGAGEALAEYIIGWLERRRSTTTAAQGGDSGGDEAQPALPLLAKPILLLQGDKALPALPRALDAHSVPHHSIVVYATCEDRFLHANLGRQKAVYECLSVGDDEIQLDGGDLDGNPDGEGEGAGLGPGEALPVGEREAREAQTGVVATPDWIVFFSPSGVDYCAPHLAQLGWFPAPAPAPDAKAGAADQAKDKQGAPDGEKDRDGEEPTQRQRRPSFSARTRPHYVALGPTTAAHLAGKYGLLEAQAQAQARVEADAEAGAGAGAEAEAGAGAGAGAEAQPGVGTDSDFDFVTAATPDPQGVRDAVERGDRLCR